MFIAQAARPRTRLTMMLTTWSIVAASALVTPSGATSHDMCTPMQASEIPKWAARDGATFAILVTVDPCADGAFDEYRLWIGDASGDKQASRTWNGTSWIPSTRYVPMLHDAGSGAWLGLQANPDATHAGLIIEESPHASIWMRWRGPHGSTAPQQLGTVNWIQEPRTYGIWGQGAAAYRDEQGRLLAAALRGVSPSGWPAPVDYADLTLPAGLDAPPGVVTPHESHPFEDHVKLARFGPAQLPTSWDLIELHVSPTRLPNYGGLRVSDGEGSLVLPPGKTPASGIIQLVGPDAVHVPTPVGLRAGETYEQLQWKDDDAPWTRASLDGPFALAKGGDTLSIHYGNLVLDAAAYGSADFVGDKISQATWAGGPVEATSIDGRLFVRAQSSDGALVDTNNPTDWIHPRIYRQHQTDREAPWFEDATVRAFVCPDRCFDEVVLRIDSATASLQVNLYDLQLVEVVEAVAEAAIRGVDVDVLLHGRPVGASSDKMARIAWAVHTMQDAGVDVRTLNFTRFDVNHAKYLVADGQWTTVLSENAVRSGWAPDGHSGNRGWGVSVQHDGLAAWMQHLFASDFGHPSDAHTPDASEFSSNPQRPPTAPVTVAQGRLPTLVVDGGVRVQPLVAPDHLGDPVLSPLVHAIQGATEEVWTQQLNLPLRWSRPGFGMDSPVALALRSAGERDVTVRGTLAGAFEDGDPTTNGNDKTVATFAALATAGASVDLRLDAGPSAGGIVHNKGWLVDPVPRGRNLIIVGSANGNLASQALNREVDLMLEHPDIAAYYRNVLLSDWEAAPPWAGAISTVEPAFEVPAPNAIAAMLALAFVFVTGRRRALLMAPRRRRPRRR